MAERYIILRRVGSKRFLGAIPIKRGVPPSVLKRQLRKSLKGGYAFRIVNALTVKKIIKHQSPRRLR
jgi:hypothetical protein